MRLALLVDAYPMTTRLLLRMTGSVDASLNSLESLDGVLSDEDASRLILNYPEVLKEGLAPQELQSLLKLRDHPVLAEAARKVSGSFELTVQIVEAVEGALMDEVEAARLIMEYPDLARDGLTSGDIRLMSHLITLPVLGRVSMLSLKDSARTLEALDVLGPLVLDGQVDELRASEIVQEYSSLFDDGVDPAERRMLLFASQHPLLAKYVYSRAGATEEGLYLLDQLAPFVGTLLDEADAVSFADRAYPELLRAAKNANQGLLEGDLDGDQLSNYLEVMIFGTLWSNPDSDGDENTDWEETLGSSLILDGGYLNPTVWSPIFEVREALFPGDYDISFLGELALYGSSVLNEGTLSLHFAAFGRSQRVDLGAFWHNFLLGSTRGDGEWYPSAGRPERFEFEDAYGKSAAWYESRLDDQGRFRVSSRNRLTYLSGTTLVLEVTTQFEALKDMENVTHLYVEFSWPQDAYRYTAMQNSNGSILSQDMTGAPEIHHFVNQTLNSGGWVAGYNSSIFDASAALVFLDARMIDSEGVHDILEVYPLAFDSADRKVDSMELHVIRPWEKITIREGTKYQLRYYLILNLDGQGYDWLGEIINQLLGRRAG